MKNVILIAFAAFYMSCNGGKSVQMELGTNHFGAKITNDNSISLTDGITQLNEKDTVTVKLEGVIQEVCQAKGCWMNLTDGNSENEIFIKFKDYAFFVPKDASGKKAIVSGKLYGNLTSVDELRHYAEDKGASEDEIAKITEDKNELRMMADGVIIYN